MRKIVLVFLLVAASAAPMFAIDFAPIQRLTVLVPLNPGIVAGANGTEWTTTLWASNTSDFDVPIACTTPSQATPCPVLPAHSTTSVPVPYADLAHQGFLIGVLVGGPFTSPNLQASQAHDLSFSLRVTDSATALQSDGTEIPLPRPSDFFAGPISLAHVPVRVSARTRLRLYGLTNGTAEVRVIGVHSNQILLVTQMTLTGVDPTPNSPLRFPSYAELALPTHYAGPADQADEAVRVEITPSGPLALWAFASVTDDISEQFTVISLSGVDVVGN
jgi:hypothetical protein